MMGALARATLARQARGEKGTKRSNTTAAEKAHFCPRVSYPPRRSRARNTRSDIRVKTPAMAGEYTEYTSLLQDMGAAIAAALRVWKNFIDTPLSSHTQTLSTLCSTQDCSDSSNRAKQLQFSSIQLYLYCFKAQQHLPEGALNWKVKTLQ